MAKEAKTTKSFIVFFMTAMLFFLQSGCGKQDAPKVEQAFLLDTIVTVSYYAEADRPAVLEAMELCGSLELVFSRTNPESELYRLNTAGSMAVSAPLLEVLQIALRFCALSGGRFDITMGGVSALYGFSSPSPAIPAPETLAAALSHVGWENIRIEGSTVTLTDPEAVIDLGAVAKGYIGDQMKELLLARGVSHAVISLGGNVVCLGGRPDGDSFRVGIQYPDRDSEKLLTTVKTAELSVVTSGVYQRFFERDGVTYHHILDPATGGSINNGLVAVSVVGPRSMDCDALSTACFSLGLKDGMALIDSLDGYFALFVTADETLHFSSGFRETLHPE